jgi:flagellar basal-body rod modification protein FlgD
MEINGTNPVTGTSASPVASTPAPTTVDYDAFLQLLVTQMRNQDPTNPTDSAEYLSQLASFSSVEQQLQSNAKLDSLLSTMAFGQGAGLIGRSVTSSDGQTTGTVVSISQVAGQTTVNLDGGSALNVSDIATVG